MQYEKGDEVKFDEPVREGTATGVVTRPNSTTEGPRGHNITIITTEHGPVSVPNNLIIGYVEEDAEQ